MPVRAKRKRPESASPRVQRARVDGERIAELLDVANPSDISAIASVDDENL